MDDKHADILTGCRKGDRRAQKELYDIYSPMLFSLCMRYLGNRQQAEDVLHDGFITIFERIKDLKNDNSLKAWMYSIMVHAALKHIRRQSKMQMVADSSTLDNNMLIEPISIDYNNYDIQVIQSAIEALPLYLRTVFNMHDVEGYSFTEIAENLNIQETTVRGYLFRAKNILKQELAHFREQQ